MFGDQTGPSWPKLTESDYPEHDSPVHGPGQDSVQQCAAASLSDIFAQQMATIEKSQGLAMALLLEHIGESQNMLMQVNALRKENGELCRLVGIQSVAEDAAFPVPPELHRPTLPLEGPALPPPTLPLATLGLHCKSDGSKTRNRNPSKRNAQVGWQDAEGFTRVHPECDGKEVVGKEPHLNNLVRRASARTLTAMSDGKEAVGKEPHLNNFVRRASARTMTTMSNCSLSFCEDEWETGADQGDCLNTCDTSLEDQNQAFKGSFLDAERLKAHVQRGLLKQTYKMSNSYRSTGICQKIARSAIFEQITLVLVTLNALWIGIDTDLNEAELLVEAHWSFIVAENLFCVFFLSEWIIRIQALKVRHHAVKDTSFVFDTCLVGVMVLETWLIPAAMLVASQTVGDGFVGKLSGLRIFRLLRLLRMARVARILRAVPELLIMVKALKAAFRSVFVTLFLLLIVTYVFGIAFAQLTVKSPVGDEMFSSVAESMYTLLLFGVLCLDYLEDIASKLNDVNPMMSVLLFVFVLLAALTIMNMLIGVLCEVVSAVAKLEKENLLVNYAHDKVGKVLEELDTDGNKLISKEELSHILANQSACKALHDVGVDVVALIDFADVMFWDSINQTEMQLSFSSFMEVVLNLRSSNVATVQDLFNLGRVVLNSFERVEQHMTNVLALLPDELRVTSQDALGNVDPISGQRPTLSRFFLSHSRQNPSSP